MKKLIAIFCCCLFLFNLVGYRLVFVYAEKEAGARIQAQIVEDEYQQNDLLKLEVDMNMPYLSADTDFEAIKGEINIEGKIYTFVKRKVQNGKLVLLCLPDEDKTKLRTAQSNFFKSANSLNNQGDSEKSSKNISKVPLSEYDQQLTFSIVPYKSVQPVVPAYERAATLFSKHCLTPEQPPELI